MSFQFDPARVEDVGRIDPLAMLLCACLADQIATLAKLYKAGAWRKDPSEIAEWLRRNPRVRNKSQVLRDEALLEVGLWEGGCTEPLLDALEAETDVVVDELKILRLARMHGGEAKGSKRGRQFYRPADGRSYKNGKGGGA